MKIQYLLILIFTTHCSISLAVESIIGSRAPCQNEGEEVSVDTIKDMSCFNCTCQNGFVECEPEICPNVDDCYSLMKKQPGSCCDRCKECFYRGKHYASGSEWTDPDDPCISFKCVSGVVTETNILCYTQCSKPQEAKTGQCCPACVGCHLNGQKVLEGHEVTSKEDPCLKCKCKDNRLTCTKKACPVLQCPISKQHKMPGECCPRCLHKMIFKQLPGKCILGQGFHSHNDRIRVDQCSSCSCINGTSVCQRHTCPVLECPIESQKTSPGDCCPSCPDIEEFGTACVYNGQTYLHNETFELDPCTSCNCQSSVLRCAQIKCESVKCRPNETLVKVPGQCCAKCVETEGICTVFGDPHYKTFDGKFFSFQGSCKYQLTADCVDKTFSIRVTNDGRNTKYASWTKTVTLKLGSHKVNLGQKLRIKVNGQRVRLPYKLDKTLSIKHYDEELILVDTKIGIKILWDGDNYLQVQAPVSYKNKLCGLCGNYNSISRDDLKPKNGSSKIEYDVEEFSNSWRVGGKKACSRTRDVVRRNLCHSKKHNKCSPLNKTDVFGQCGSRLNPINYFEACLKDMCECNHDRCFCESFKAYARECTRLGIDLPNWRNDTNCLINRHNNRHNGNRYSNNHNNLNSNLDKSNSLVSNNFNSNSNSINNNKHKLNNHNSNLNINESSEKVFQVKHKRHRNRTNKHIFKEHLPNKNKENKPTVLNLGRTPPPLH